MTSLEIVNKKLYWIKKNKATGVFIEESELNQIKQDLEFLRIFKQYISLNYIKNLISENEFSLNNFDWDIKDEEIITKRIKELSILVKCLESNKVGDSK